ncbi:hypothetical protein VNO80_17214 [Phaseolus coccineus]|uniref:Uncharacterized protein n=1 Tax=Phaseolus coccineus TaxID=3886 RepID=A0AAN9R3F5_PHACN
MQRGRRIYLWSLSKKQTSSRIRLRGVEAGEDVDLAEHSPAFAGVGDGDDVVIDERGEDGGDGTFNVADGVTVDVADVDGVGVVRVVGSRRRRTKERRRMVAQ